jgi:hypothetical protein
VHSKKLTEADYAFLKDVFHAQRRDCSRSIAQRAGTSLPYREKQTKTLLISAPSRPVGPTDNRIASHAIHKKDCENTLTRADPHL